MNGSQLLNSLQLAPWPNGCGIGLRSRGSWVRVLLGSLFEKIGIENEHLEKETEGDTAEQPNLKRRKMHVARVVTVVQAAEHRTMLGTVRHPAGTLPWNAVLSF
eukprot:2522409-Amphidinium_carterae.1